MCTLSIIVRSTSPAYHGASRAECTLAFNRDEQRTRAEGLPLEIASYGGRRAIHPRDPDGGGTWIAVNDAGLAFALLNRNEHGVPDGRAQGLSRGVIIPGLLDCGELDEAASRARRLARDIARGFRLIATDGLRVLEVIGGEHRESTALASLTKSFMRTSSGLGDALVREPRTALFESMVAGAPDDAREAAQSAFHAHSWPDRRHLSVLMDRAEARTVSQTIVAIGPARIDVAHALRAADRPSNHPSDHVGDHVGDRSGERDAVGFAPYSTRSLPRGDA